MSETGIYIRVGNDNVLLEDLDEIERTLWLQSLSENGLIRTVNRCCDVIEDFIVNYQHLQQENQQLKEQLKDENNYHNEAVKWYKEAFDIEQERIKYKSVLDEIREQLKKIKPDLDFEPWSVYKVIGRKLFDLLQILDKVGSNDNKE